MHRRRPEGYGRAVRDAQRLLLDRLDIDDLLVRYATATGARGSAGRHAQWTRCVRQRRTIRQRQFGGRLGHSG